VVVKWRGRGNSCQSSWPKRKYGEREVRTCHARIGHQTSASNGWENFSVGGGSGAAGESEEVKSANANEGNGI